MSVAERVRPRLVDVQTRLAQIRKARRDPWVHAVMLPHVQCGETCGQCEHWMDPVKGQEFLKKDGFWERTFHGHDDGHDLTRSHIGDPRDYSVCKKKGHVASHKLSTCTEFGRK